MVLNTKIIKEVVKEFGTPIYIYDKQKLINRLEEMTSIEYKNTKFYAATMANSNPFLFKIYKSFCFGAFINSIKHLHHVRKMGFRNQDIMWTSTGMNERQMISSIKEGTLLNLDSLNQLELYGRLNSNSKVGIRVNLEEIPSIENYAGTFIGKKSRLGIFPEEFDLLFSIAEKYNLKIIGLHIYLGTQIYDLNYFRIGANKLIEQIKRFKDLEYLDFGGGFGVADESSEKFNFKEYNHMMTQIMENVSKEFGRSIQLILEPGRVLAGDSAIFVSRVTDIKYRENCVFVLVEGSSAIFSRPLFYPDSPNHPNYVLGKQKGERINHAFICGSTTYSKDFLARDSKTISKSVKIGDIIILENAGSYSYYSKTDFLGIEIPPQILVDGSNYELISEGERYP